MIDVDEHLAVLIAAVETLSIVVAHTCTPNRHDLTLRVVIHSRILTPQADRDAESALVSYHYIAAVFDRAGLLYVDLG